MKARFPGRCKCGARFDAGSEIFFDRDTKSVLRCGTCNPHATQPPPREREELAQLTCLAAERNRNALLAQLDDDQRTMADWRPDQGNARVSAAAGSGKTTAIVALVSSAVAQGFQKRSVVVSTFTAKAAAELRVRLSNYLPAGTVESMRIGTFHALGLRELKKLNSERWQMSRCLDGSASDREHGIPSLTTLWTAVIGPKFIPGTGERGIGLEEPDVPSYMRAIELVRADGHTLEDGHEACAAADLSCLYEAWQHVEEAKCALRAWEFADVLSAWLAALGNGAATMGSPRMVVIDEAQDNSRVQLEIARKLVGPDGALMLVGQGAQAIYEWRGGYPHLFLHADTEIGAKSLRLRHNYRSLARIVDLGNAILKGKSWDVSGPATATRGTGGRIQILPAAPTPAAEARLIAETISHEIDGGAAVEDFAILCRTNALAGLVEAALIRARVPVVVSGGSSFFASGEARDVLAYLTLSAHNDLSALRRIVNRPRRGLGDAFARDVERETDTGTPLLDAVEACAAGCRTTDQRNAARDLAGQLRQLRALAWPEAAGFVRDLYRLARAGRSEAPDADRRQTAGTFAELARDFHDVDELLRFSESCQSTTPGSDSPQPGRVRISTVHRMKGGEAKHVFVPGMAEGSFPHYKAELDAEERLFYVAVTRARETLTFTHSETDLFTRKVDPSPLLAYTGVRIERKSVVMPACPKCAAPMVVHGDRMLRCSTYPECRSSVVRPALET